MCFFPVAVHIWLIFYTFYHLVYSSPVLHGEFERILSAIHLQRVSHHRFVLQKDNFSKPYLPFFLPGQCCFLYYSTLARWLGILRNQFRQSLPQPAWHLHKETWHFVPHKGLPTFPRTEKDREYSWVRLLTTIKEHVGTKRFFSTTDSLFPVLALLEELLGIPK